MLTADEEEEAYDGAMVEADHAGGADEALTRMDHEAAEEEGAFGPAPSAPPLQHSLPAQLNHDPSRMLSMHESFFPLPLSAAGDRLTAALPGGRPSSQAPAAAAAAAVGAGGGRPQHIWRRGPSPITSSLGGTEGAHYSNCQSILPLTHPLVTPQTGD